MSSIGVIGVDSMLVIPPGDPAGSVLSVSWVDSNLVRVNEWIFERLATSGGIMTSRGGMEFNSSNIIRVYFSLEMLISPLKYCDMLHSITYIYTWV